jgi:hypothetical protein
VLSILREVTARQECCAIVDASDVFNPHAAAAAGVPLERLLWVRCRRGAEDALKATDLLLQAGGFGLVLLDMGDVPPEIARRISLASWYRLRRAIENTPTILLVLEQEPVARPCASVTFEMQRRAILWKGRLFHGIQAYAECRKRKAG